MKTMRVFSKKLVLNTILSLIGTALTLSIASMIYGTSQFSYYWLVARNMFGIIVLADIANYSRVLLGRSGNVFDL